MPPSMSIAASLLVILLAGGVSLYLLSRGVPETDEVTLCPAREQLKEVVVLLLDMSDRLSVPQRLKVKNEIQRLILLCQIV